MKTIRVFLLALLVVTAGTLIYAEFVYPQEPRDSTVQTSLAGATGFDPLRGQAVV